MIGCSCWRDSACASGPCWCLWRPCAATKLADGSACDRCPTVVSPVPVSCARLLLYVLLLLLLCCSGCQRPSLHQGARRELVEGPQPAVVPHRDAANDGHGPQRPHRRAHPPGLQARVAAPGPHGADQRRAVTALPRHDRHRLLPTAVPGRTPAEPRPAAAAQPRAAVVTVGEPVWAVAGAWCRWW